MEAVLEYAIKSGAGIFTLLFIALLTWVLKTNDSREKRYIDVIDKQAVVLQSMTSIEKDVDEIKGDIKSVLGRLSN